MDADRWQRIEALFDLVADLPPAEQEARLRTECDGDNELFAQLLALLNHDRSRGGRIAGIIEALGQIDPPEEIRLAGRRIGAYRIVREIGRGGMGVVFEAVRDDDEFSKRVALKVSTRAAYAPEFLQRFRDERQILARLEHPHIARLLDGGTTEEQIPFFVMEFVEGTPIHEYAATHSLPLASRLRLFLQVCDAVEYAHQNLIIHRDLKPANILVAGDSVRLLDFGIAKLADETGASSTSTGFAAGTPDYCSPEQIRGQPVTTRTDVYSLGLILFELLTGERAQKADTSSPVTLDRSICESATTPPSAVVMARGEKALARALRGDIDTIVLTAVQKDPSRRYASAAALADDLRRHLEARPIRARQDSTWYRAARFARRHWMPLAASVLLLVTLIGGIIATSIQARRAERRFQQVRRIANALIGDVHRAIRELPGSTKAQEVVVRTAIEYLDALSKEAGSDRALQLETARGYLQVAILAYDFSRPSLGRPEEAARYYEKARAILEPLGRDAPGDPAVAAALTTLYTRVGDHQADTGRTEAAMESYERAIATSEDALERHPENLDLMDELREAQHSLISSFTGSPAARKHIARHIEITERVFARRPVNADTLANLGLAYSQAAKVAETEGNDADTVKYLNRNVEIQARVVAMVPDNVSARRNLMLAWFHIGDHFLGPLGPGSYTGASGPRIEVDPARLKKALDAYVKGSEQSEWLYRSDPTNETARYDYAIGLGRSAAAYPPGDLQAIGQLEKALAVLSQIEPEGPKSTLGFLIEFRGALAERRRQAGQLARAAAEWSAFDALARQAIAAEPGRYYFRRLSISVYQNWALELARRRDRGGALALIRRIERLANEVAALESQYSRAAGWPPRTKAWSADVFDRLGDRAAATEARKESAQMWSRVAARKDIPQDLADEARQAAAARR